MSARIADCGTYNAYARHLYRQETPCNLCQNAKKEWSQKNYLSKKDLILKTKKEKYALNPETFKSSDKRSKAKHVERVKENKRTNERKRRAKRKDNLTSKYTEKEILEIYGNFCHICGKSIDLTAPRKSGIVGWENGLHIDHVIPIAKGGNDTLNNVKPAHGKCNVLKGAN